jgi:hypothetical protein
LVGAPAGYLRHLPAPFAAINLQHGLLSHRGELMKTLKTEDGRTELRAATGSFPAVCHGNLTMSAFAVRRPTPAVGCRPIISRAGDEIVDVRLGTPAAQKLPVRTRPILGRRGRIFRMAQPGSKPWSPLVPRRSQPSRTTTSMTIRPAPIAC